MAAWFQAATDSRRTRSAPTKHPALSLTTFDGFPRQPMNLRNASRN